MQSVSQEFVERSSDDRRKYLRCATNIVEFMQHHAANKDKQWQLVAMPWEKEEIDRIQESFSVVDNSSLFEPSAFPTETRDDFFGVRALFLDEEIGRAH